MIITRDQIHTWLQNDENEHLECKEAKNRFDFELLVKYCAALANEGGGIMLLGVTDKPPRRVVGSRAFSNIGRTKAGLTERLHLRIDAEELRYPEGRVLVFHVPSRPLGVPIGYKGAYWMRSGEELVPMTPDLLKRIFDETGPDFSAEICPKATIGDIDKNAVENFRQRWIAKTGKQNLDTLSHKQLLSDIEAVVDGNVTYAALILFGTHKALGKYLAQAEVTFEYRSSEASGPAQNRREFRQGFFNYYDKLWDIINLRNDLQNYQDGFFILDIPTFHERAVREAILNAVCHRDYRLAGNIFVRQYSRRIEITSPGGLPPEVTLENILDRQSPRNRRIADIFAKCGLVERSGQGMNLIFETAIRESKPLPGFSGTDDFQVCLTLNGTVQNPDFIRFLEKIGKTTQQSFSTRDWLILDYVSQQKKIPEHLKSRLQDLIELGILERIRKGRVILSRKYYSFIGKKGEYTRKRGLDRETNKVLLEKHIKDHGREGSPMRDLLQVLPALTREQVKGLLQELRKEKRIHLKGEKRGALWFPDLDSDRKEV